MDTRDIIIALVNGLIGVATFSIRQQISSVRELLELRIGSLEKRLERMENAKQET